MYCDLHHLHAAEIDNYFQKKCSLLPAKFHMQKINHARSISAKSRKRCNRNEKQVLRQEAKPACQIFMHFFRDFRSVCFCKILHAKRVPRVNAKPAFAFTLGNLYAFSHFFLKPACEIIVIHRCAKEKAPPTKASCAFPPIPCLALMLRIYVSGSPENNIAIKSHVAEFIKALDFADILKF